MVENAHLQFYFGKLAVLMNFKSEAMEGYVAPTDSRWRQDLRLYEEGLVEDSDDAKVIIENRQREQRQLVKDGKATEHKPHFFREVEHPYVTNDVLETQSAKPVKWELIEGENGYWARRERKDWKGLPNIWG